MTNLPSSSEMNVAQNIVQENSVMTSPSGSTTVSQPNQGMFKKTVALITIVMLMLVAAGAGVYGYMYVNSNSISVRDQRYSSEGITIDHVRFVHGGFVYAQPVDNESTGGALSQYFEPGSYRNIVVPWIGMTIEPEKESEETINRFREIEPGEHVIVYIYEYKPDIEEIPVHTDGTDRPAYTDMHTQRAKDMYGKIVQKSIHLSE